MFAVKYDTTKTRSQEQQAIDEAALVAINSIHPNSPPSMDSLFDTNSLFIHRVSRPNPYTAPMPFNSSANILNKTGQHVFWATEENRLRTEIGCCGSCSPFEVQVLNQQGHVVIQMSRTGDCSVFCLPCCMPSMRVESPPGVFLGSVQQMCSLFCTKKYAIKSKNGYTVMVLRGPGRCICPKGKIVFKVSEMDTNI